ncbi:hypothetical protein K0B96_12715 [Horticoccus luteus]|uniref:AsmA domain-containing protein n=1 Tax=Horticoccus luteus TaxID=2862869 RepID=A0A8F9TSD8_9BACT|nr:hypothetical protein [Horticoccus luteus]QYM78165.1 hypothetical protein K0B96_12715 [Horticoccus luteus]
MKKFLLSLVVVVAILALVVFIVGRYFVGTAITASVNKFGPELTQTNVHLDSASISPFSGHGTLTNFVVGNPQGWSDRNAFHLGQVSIDLKPTTVLGDQPIVINSIAITQPEIVYETHLVSSNIGDLMKNIEAATGGDKPKPTDEKKPPRKLIVKHFVLSDAKVTVGVGTAAITVPMPTVELNDLGVKEGGITPGQLAFAISRSVTAQVVASAASAIGKNGVEDTVKKAGSTLKDLLGGKK